MAPSNTPTHYNTHAHYNTDTQHLRYTGIKQNAGIALAAAICAVILFLSGDSLPLPPLKDARNLNMFLSWWTEQNNFLFTALSLVKTLGLLLCGYLLMISLMAVVACLTRWRWLAILTRWVTAPTFKRVIAGSTLTMALSAQAAAASGAPFTVQDIGSVRTTSQSVHTTMFTLPPTTQPATQLPSTAQPSAPFTVQDIGTAYDINEHTTHNVSVIYDIENDITHNSNVTYENDTTSSIELDTNANELEGDSYGESIELAWHVLQGDNLWNIATHVLKQQTGSAAPHMVQHYMAAIISSNQETLGDNPDLIHPGQIIQLPQIPQLESASVHSQPT